MTTVEVMAPLAQAAVLVNALLPLLAPGERQRVQAALAGGVPGLMQRLALLPWEAGAETGAETGAEGPSQSGDPSAATERCLTLSFAADDTLLAFAAAQLEPDPAPDPAALEPGRVQVGCWWCGLTLGVQQVQFSATAATAAMAELLDSSAQVRGAFLQVAQAVPGGALARVDAWNEAVLLWADVQATAAAQASLASGLPLPPLDAYCRHLLAHGWADSGHVYG